MALSYLNFWGKADQETGRWHPLICHMLDVAAVAREVLNREPESTKKQYAMDYQLPWEEAEKWIILFIALHDIGKATPSFQMMIEDKSPLIKEQLFFENLTWDSRVQYVHHGILGQLIFEKEVHPFMGIDCQNLIYISRAINSHHGFYEPADLSSNLRNAGLKKNQIDWQKARELLIVALYNFLVKEKKYLNLEMFTGASYIRLAGLTSFSDWIGSDTNHYNYFINPESFSLENYWEVACNKAIKALDSIGWLKRHSLFDYVPEFEKVFSIKPRPLQDIVDQQLKIINEPSLIIIEAPTGEGKTEAAFFSHIVLQKINNHRGMYVALPSQATGNAMFIRTKEFLSKSNDSYSLDLQLIHGAILLNESFQEIRLHSVYDNENEEKSVIANEWFTHKKRSLLSEYGVGTVDQALLSVLNIKHNFVRLWGLGNRTIIIDEVHAYDVYTSTILDRLLMWLKALGSSVIIMSATLPQKRKLELLHAWGVNTCEKEKYPCITLAQNDGKATNKHFETDKSRSDKIYIKAAPVDIDELAKLSIDLIKNGGCLAVIVNTVQRAQDLYNSLQSINIDYILLLFHARFPAGRRTEKENEIISFFGKPGEGVNRPPRAILVATQVVEQSLDLDFDVMISDLAPIDLLLQRAGRVHRHTRQSEERYQHSEPLLYICGIKNDKLPEIGKPIYWDMVYMPYILYKTWYLLKNLDYIQIPESIDKVIEYVYGENVGNHDFETGSVVVDAFQNMQRIIEEDRTVVNTLLGKPIGCEWANPAGIQKIEDENIKPGMDNLLRAKTRKGDQNITLILLFEYNEKLYLSTGREDEVELDRHLDVKDSIKVYKNAVSVSRKDIFNHFINIPVPAGWKNNPVLRNCRPLILQNSRYNIGSATVFYSDELGVYYERKK